MVNLIEVWLLEEIEMRYTLSKCRIVICKVRILEINHCLTYCVVLYQSRLSYFSISANSTRPFSKYSKLLQFLTRVVGDVGQ